MSPESFMNFLIAARDNRAVLVRYDQRNQSQILFHAKNEGFDFTAEEMAEVVGKLEASTILNKDKSPFDGTSPLWRRMWGQRHLGYLIEHVVQRHTDEELRAMVAPTGAGAA